MFRSTRLLHQLGGRYGAVLTSVRRILHSAVRRARGHSDRAGEAGLRTGAHRGEDLFGGEGGADSAFRRHDGALKAHPPARVAFQRIGRRRLKGLPEPTELFRAGAG